MSTHVAHDLVIFDGVCNLCAHSVRFILQCEADSALHFVPLQSRAGTRLLRQFEFDPGDVRTFVLIANGLVHVKSGAALKIAQHLRWPWRALTFFRIIPRPVRDWLYDRVAQNRYRWFGRTEICMVPTPDLRVRFIED